MVLLKSGKSIKIHLTNAENYQVSRCQALFGKGSNCNCCVYAGVLTLVVSLSRPLLVCIDCVTRKLMSHISFRAVPLFKDFLLCLYHTFINTPDCFAILFCGEHVT